MSEQQPGNGWFKVLVSLLLALLLASFAYTTLRTDRLEDKLDVFIFGARGK